MPQSRPIPSRVLLLTVTSVILFAQVSQAAVWYVDKDNTAGTQDGASWATAYTTLQPAIEAVFADLGGGPAYGWDIIRKRMLPSSAVSVRGVVRFAMKCETVNIQYDSFIGERYE